MEMIPVPTVTLTTQQILTGDLNGKPATIAGELRIPKAGTDKLPAIIMVHGSGGLSASPDHWARELNSVGIAVFILDSFAGRGIVSTVTDQSQLDHLAMAVDAYRALGVLAAHPRIDPARVAVIGFSKGASRRSIRPTSASAGCSARRMPNSPRTSGSIRRAMSAIATTIRSPASRSGCITASRTTGYRSSRAALMSGA